MPRPLLHLALLAALTAGCATAAPTATEPVEDVASIDDQAAYEAPAVAPYEEDAYPVASPVPSTRIPAPAPAATPTPEPAYVAPEAESLAIGKLSVKSSGVWLWKRATARVEVTNPTKTTRSGTVSITFTRDGAAVETVQDGVVALEPGDTYVFEAKSTKRADDAEAVVDTER